MGADSAPDDVRLAGVNLIAVLEGGAAVRRPSHLPNAGVPLDALDPKARVKALAALGKIGDELLDRFAEGLLLLRG